MQHDCVCLFSLETKLLVYAKLPMGYTSVGGKRVYGRNFCYGKFGPTEIPYNTFMEHREQLEEVVYTSALLEQLFSGSFPNVSFRLTEIHKLDFDILVEVANALGLEYIKGRSKPTLQHKRALRKSVLARITD